MLLLGDIVRRHAQYRGGRLAYVVDHADGRAERVTYAELNAGTNRLASVLQARGVRRGDRVAILAHNCVEYPWTYFACCKLGAIVVPVNTRYKRDEIRYAIDFSEARIALIGPEFADDVLALRAEGALPHLRDVLLVDAGGAAALPSGVATLAPSSVAEPTRHLPPTPVEPVLTPVAFS